MEYEGLELEESSTALAPVDDPRPRMPEPLPVRLVAVEDCRQPASTGLEAELDAFYVGLLGFERADVDGQLAYRAENFRLIFEQVQGLVERQSLRPLRVDVPSLRDFLKLLSELGLEYIRQRGLTPGLETVLLRDPAGNPLEVGQYGLAI